ncbi:MAG: SAM-dependent methyltransferase [Clostridiales bacterium]|nr:MAG: SAM-dependent methyltransferase [Clostridiales bacterium]
MANFFQNTRKPEGLGGKIMVNMMNSGHARPSKWGFSHISPKVDDHILDIGCGGGANIAKLLKICTKGIVKGIDHSEISVAKSIKVNQAAVDAGRCEIIQGNVLALPYESESFNLVTAFETIYFWPEIETAFKGIYDVLKPGGRFMICNEVDGEREKAEKWTKIIDGMTVYSPTDIEKLLTSAGFNDITIDVELKHNWLCVIATK